MVFIGGKDIKTLPGRIIQLIYWFISFVLIAAYAANLMAIFSIDHYETDINSYRDISGKTIGCFEAYQAGLEAFQAKVKTYS